MSKNCDSCGKFIPLPTEELCSSCKSMREPLLCPKCHGSIPLCPLCTVQNVLVDQTPLNIVISEMRKSIEELKRQVLEIEDLRKRVQELALKDRGT